MRYGGGIKKLSVDQASWIYAKIQNHKVAENPKWSIWAAIAITNDPRWLSSTSIPYALPKAANSPSTTSRA